MYSPNLVVHTQYTEIIVCYVNFLVLHTMADDYYDNLRYNKSKY